MKTLLLLLALCLSASAQSVPIRRPTALHSPKYAATARETRMRVASTEPPLLPMQPFYRKVQSEYGTEEFYAQALQPANQSVLFELSPDMEPGSWIGLAFFPSYPADQPVFAGLTSYQQRMVIRAKATPVMPSGFTRLATTGKAVWINPAVRGSFARRGTR